MAMLCGIVIQGCSAAPPNVAAVARGVGLPLRMRLRGGRDLGSGREDVGGGDPMGAWEEEEEEGGGGAGEEGVDGGGEEGGWEQYGYTGDEYAEIKGERGRKRRGVMNDEEEDNHGKNVGEILQEMGIVPKDGEVPKGKRMDDPHAPDMARQLGKNPTPCQPVP